MPERDKSVRRIASAIVGGKAFNGLSGDVIEPYIPKAKWQGLQALVDELWVAEVRRIDWNRVILTAESRHRELRRLEEERDSEHHGPNGYLSDERPFLGLKFGDEEDNICPECLVESLLELTTMSPDRDNEPERMAKRDRFDLAWRTDWLNDAGGSFSTVQAILPHALKASEDHEAARVKETPDDDD